MLFFSESSLRKNLHGQRSLRINEALGQFKKQHANDPDLDKKLSELNKKLEAEALRVYPMIDQSILKERVKRAKYSAAITGCLTVLAAIALGAILGTIMAVITSPLALVTPFIAAGIAGIVSVNTIDISYNARVKGAMNSVSTIYENDLAKEKSTSIAPGKSPLVSVPTPQKEVSSHLDKLNIPRDVSSGIQK